MRKIEYRAIGRSDGGWVYGIPYKTDLGNWMMRDDDGVVHPIDPETIGEWTGLKDMNGKNIYEDDIIRHGSYENPFLCMWTKKFTCFAFEENGENETIFILACDCDRILVIGDIHHNPELLNPSHGTV